MARLEELTRDAWVKGVLPDAVVNVIDVKWHGSSVVELTAKDTAGRLGTHLLHRDRGPTLETASARRPCRVDGDGEMLPRQFDGVLLFPFTRDAIKVIRESTGGRPGEVLRRANRLIDDGAANQTPVIDAAQVQEFFREQVPHAAVTPRHPPFGSLEG